MQYSLLPKSQNTSLVNQRARVCLDHDGKQVLVNFTAHNYLLPFLLHRVFNTFLEGKDRPFGKFLLV